MRPALSILSLVLCFALSAGAAQAQSYTFFRVDGPGGVQANGGVFEPALSADGRVLVFSVGSGSLLSGGASGAQVIALDLGSGVLSVVSGTPGGQASAASTVNEKAVASANGRFVAFDTASSTYTGGAAGVHVVRIDRVTGTAALVNLTASGTLPTGTLSRVGGISGDGRYVVFSSNASGLVAGDAGSSSFAVYVRDLSAGTTQRIDLTPGGGPGNGGAGSERPTISEDGRWVAFASSASNLLGTLTSGSVRILSLPMSDDGAIEIARRARGTPRIAGRLLRRVRDFASVAGAEIVDRKVADAALSRLEVDSLGLDSLDRRYLNMIARNFGGGPVGIETIAAGLSEPRDAIEDIIEPYLIQQGFIQRTPRGRVLTANAWRHLGLEAPKDIAQQQIALFEDE